MTGMRALLLCAGIGSRLRPLTNVLPKCLMPINGRPLLGYWLHALREAGVASIMVNLHHHSDLVREYVRRSPFSKHVTLVEEPQLLGTGGTLLQNREFFAGAPVLMAHADNLSVFAPLRFLDAHEKRPDQAVMTMMTFTTSAPRMSGVVEMDGRGIVTAFHEKSGNPPGNIANAAVYMIEPPVVEYLASLNKNTIDFSTEAIPHFIGKIFAVHNSIYHCDIGVLAALAQAQLDFPLVKNARFDGKEGDPWYGLLDQDSGRLAQDLARSIHEAFHPVRVTDALSISR